MTSGDDDEILIQEARENMRDLGCDEDTVEYQIEVMRDEGGMFRIPEL